MSDRKAEVTVVIRVGDKIQVRNQMREVGSVSVAGNTVQMCVTDEGGHEMQWVNITSSVTPS